MACVALSAESAYSQTLLALGVAVVAEGAAHELMAVADTGASYQG
jgi:hypothetical protein